MLAFYCCVGLAGCAATPYETTSLDKGAIELTATPFFPQEKYQCGPAALTTVLVQSGADIAVDDMVSQVYVPGRKGSLQPELLAATRAVGRIPYPINGSISAVYAELAAGRPVLALQNLGIKQIPRWHYAVVVGIDPDAGNVFLRSGTEQRRQTKLKTFLKAWQRSDYWAFVALRPGELPAQPDAMRFIAAVTAAESTGHRSAAHASWIAAVARWPQNPVALFGLGNAAYALQNYASAEQHFRQILEMRPDYLIAGNNLALALAKQGRLQDALQQIDRVLRETDPGDALLPEYTATLREIQGMFGNSIIF